MEFTYTDVFYVDDIDLAEMVAKVENGMDAYDAIKEYSDGFDDYESYAVSCIEDALADEIDKRAGV